MSEETASVPVSTDTEPTTEPAVEPTAEPMVVEAPFPALVGIDLGNEEIVLACCQAQDSYPTVVRNDTSDTGTKTLVSFKNLERLFGESAVGHVRIPLHFAFLVCSVVCLVLRFCLCGSSMFTSFVPGRVLTRFLLVHGL